MWRIMRFRSASFAKGLLTSLLCFGCGLLIYNSRSAGKVHTENPNGKRGHHLENQFMTNATLIAGNTLDDQAFLVIGLPTVQRANASYLLNTLQGLVDGLDKQDKNQVLIVVFVADLNNPQHAEDVAHNISEKFPSELASGLIQVITAPASYYPPLTGLPLLYGDSQSRVYWRSKQCIDYAFLFGYAGSLGRYYMQLEDDVISQKGYFKATKEFITENEKKEWLFLEMGFAGFIGMVFKSADTRRLSVFFKMYYWVYPIDWLFRQFATFELYGNPSWARHQAPMFIHIGKVSSLKGQVRPLAGYEKIAASKTRTRKRFHSHKNPPAVLSTTMADTVDNVDINTAYHQELNSRFWAKTVRIGDSITIVFNKTLKLRKVVFVSGITVAPEDTFGAVRLETSHAINANDTCLDFSKWKEFSGTATICAGMSRDRAIESKCLRLSITKLNVDSHNMIRWLAIQEIAVWAW